MILNFDSLINFIMFKQFCDSLYMYNEMASKCRTEWLKVL